MPGFTHPGLSPKAWPLQFCLSGPISMVPPPMMTRSSPGLHPCSKTFLGPPAYMNGSSHSRTTHVVHYPKATPSWFHPPYQPRSPPQGHLSWFAPVVLCKGCHTWAGGQPIGGHPIDWFKPVHASRTLRVSGPGSTHTRLPSRFYPAWVRTRQVRYDGLPHARGASVMVRPCQSRPAWLARPSTVSLTGSPHGGYPSGAMYGAPS